jgi:schlafen family protein
MPRATLELLEAGRGNAIIGTRESQQIEFKQTPYRLDEERQKFELAKDVSALANASGGIVVLGVRTERDETHPWDKAVAVTPFPSNLINAQQIRDVLQAWIFPPVEGIEVRIFQDAVRADHSLAAIWVPAQRGSVGPFVVIKAADDANRIDGSLIGYFERRAADARPLSAHEVQAILRDGLLFRRALDERAGTPPPTPAGPRVAPERVPTPPAQMPPATYGHLVQLVEATQLADVPLFALSTTPVPPVEASGMFQAEDHDITELLRHPPELRNMGFDLATQQDPKIIRGESRRAVLSTYKGLELRRDGTLLFVATADNDFLSWGERRAQDPLRINPVPLLESALLFTTLAKQVYDLVPLAPQHVVCTLTLRRLCIENKRPLLKPGRADWRLGADPRQAQGCDHDVVVVVDFPFDPAQVAFQLIREVYTWFGLTYDRIPYVTDNAIDAEALRRL